MVDDIPSFVLAIDPGTTESGYTALKIAPDGEYELAGYGKVSNSEMSELVDGYAYTSDNAVLVVEKIQSYGAIVGESTFETVLWSGRFIERWLRVHEFYYRIPRKDCVKCVTGSGNGKDADVFRCLKQRFGEPGTKKEPGFLYGMTNDARAAFAVALTLIEGNKTYTPET